MILSIQLFDEFKQAVKQNNFDLVKDLLKTYKNIGYDMLIHDAFNTAIISQNLDMIKLIIKYVTLKELNKKSKQYLSKSVKTRNISIVRFLVEYGLDVHICKHKYFLEAVSYGSFSIIKCLYDNGLNDTFLLEESIQYAAYSGSFRIIKFLLDILKEPQIININSRRHSIKQAIYMGHLKCSKYLLKYWKIDNLSWVYTDKNLLISALLNGNIKFIKWLMSILKISKNILYESHKDDIIIAENNININSFIIKRIRYLDTFNINTVNTAMLYYCCRVGYIDGVKYLIAKGIDINQALSFQEATALMIAVIFRRFDVARYLILKGAHFNITLKELKGDDRKMLKALIEPLYKRKYLNEKTEKICFICNEQMLINNEMIIQCKVCNKCTHFACQIKWKAECIFCRSPS